MTTAVHVALTILLGSVAFGEGGWQQGQAPNPEPSLPQVLLSTMHQVNQLEMRLGRLAEEKGASADVRRYGDRLYRDHRFGDRRVTALAASQDLNLLPPDQLPTAPKLQPVMAEAETLGQETGPAFDRAFLQLMVRSHEMATGMLRDAEGSLPSGQVQDLVSRLLPILEQHLALARAIQSESREG